MHGLGVRRRARRSTADGRQVYVKVGDPTHCQHDGVTSVEYTMFNHSLLAAKSVPRFESIRVKITGSQIVARTTSGSLEVVDRPVHVAAVICCPSQLFFT